MVESRTLLREERLLQRQLQEAKDVLDSVKDIFYLANGKVKDVFTLYIYGALVFAKTWPEFSVSYHSKTCACKLL